MADWRTNGRTDGQTDSLAGWLARRSGTHLFQARLITRQHSQNNDFKHESDEEISNKATSVRGGSDAPLFESEGDDDKAPRPK